MHPEPFVFQHPGAVLRMDRAAAATGTGARSGSASHSTGAINR